VVRRHPTRGLTTLLFTDIVDSSEIAVELGDRRWQILQKRHHAEVRRYLKHHGGREVDTAGDGFFATFGSPAAGIRCAAEIVAAVRDLGLDVRAGLHIGEVELTGEKVSGIAVTTAARVAALAGPGQILVTSTLAQMAQGSGLGFEHVVTRELKGVPGSWDLKRLATVDGTPVGLPLDPDDAEEMRKRASPEPAPRTRRRVVVPVIAGSTIALVVGAAVYTSGRSEAPSAAPSTGQSLAGAVAVRLDLTDGSALPVDIPNIPFDAPVGPVVLTRRAGRGDQEFAWILSVVPEGSRIALWKVDRASGQPVDHTLTRGCTPPIPCVVPVNDRVWIAVSSARLGEVSPGVAVMGVDITGPKNIQLPVSSKVELSTVHGMAYGDGSLWIGDSLRGVVANIDLASGEQAEHVAGDAVDAVAFGDGDLWVIDRFGGVVRRIDPRTGLITGHQFVEGDPNSVVVGGGFVWVTDGSGNAVEKMPTSLDAPPTTIPVGDQPVAIAYSEGEVWVANHNDGTVSEIDPGVNQVVKTYPVGIHPSSVAVDGNQLWVTGNPSGIDRS
jgi:YVTN family beta-propeller protein